MSSFLQSVVLPAGPCLWALQRAAPPGAAKTTDTTAVADDEQPEEPLCCVGCGHPIARAADRIEMAGRHAHTCVNPAGFVFHIGCFASAPGCVGVGAWSSEYAWFAGYEWQVACCCRCSMHLGWAFAPQGGTGAGRTFHGLIVDRLHTPGVPPARA